MKISNLEINSVLQSVFGLDGGSMFGIVPKPLWSKVYPADELNRIDMAGRIFIISYQQRNIIIETGMGTKYDEKFKKIYNIRINDLSQLLGGLSLSEEMITDVIVSHLHFDHAGGLTKREGDKILPVFPNATIYVQKAQLENALHPSIKDRGSYIREDFEFLTNYEKVILLDGEFSITENIKIRPVSGHTPMMQTIYIDAKEENFIFTADLIPTARHIRLPYIMAYDINPIKTIEEKRGLLDFAVENNSILLFPHDIFTPAARVLKKGDDFDIEEEIKL